MLIWRDDAACPRRAIGHSEMTNADFRVVGFAGPKHPRLRCDDLWLTTEHSGVASAQTEVEAWQQLMARGTASYCSITDLRPGGAMTNPRVEQHTKLDWK